MKYVIRDREDDQRFGDFVTKTEAVYFLKLIRKDIPKFAPYRLVRLETRREKVIRDMRHSLTLGNVFDDMWAVGYDQATEDWLNMLTGETT